MPHRHRNLYKKLEGEEAMKVGNKIFVLKPKYKNGHQVVSELIVYDDKDYNPINEPKTTESPEIIKTPIRYNNYYEALTHNMNNQDNSKIDNKWLSLTTNDLFKSQYPSTNDSVSRLMDMIINMNKKSEVRYMQIIESITKELTTYQEMCKVLQLEIRQGHAVYQEMRDNFEGMDNGYRKLKLELNEKTIEIESLLKEKRKIIKKR